MEDQFASFREGFFEMIPKDLVNVFDERELEVQFFIHCPFILSFSILISYFKLLIGGISDIDIADWKKHTDHRGYTETDEVVQWFWICIESWDTEKRARLLQFVTGTSRIPVNGFRDLQGSDGPRRFTIEKSGDPQMLPKSHTCFNRLDLPQYKKFEDLDRKVHIILQLCYLNNHLIFIK